MVDAVETTKDALCGIICQERYKRMQILISLRSKVKTIWLTFDLYESNGYKRSTEIVIVTTGLSSVHYIW